MVGRVKTGVPGLDELLEGGFPEHATILVSGAAGTGKTTLCSQFCWEGLQQGESCLFVTLEEEPDEIVADAREFGWDFEQHGDRFDMIYMDPFNIVGGFMDRIVQEIEEIGADRVVIDSTSVLGMHDADPQQIRKRLYELTKELREMETTVVLTAEIPEDESNKMSRFGVEEFVVDGVIKLTGFGLDDSDERTLQVVKMRKTLIDGNLRSMVIDRDGVSVDPDATR